MIMESSAYNFRHLVAGKILDRLAFISNFSSPLPVSFSVRDQKAQPCGDRTLAVHLLVMLVVKLVQWACRSVSGCHSYTTKSCSNLAIHKKDVNHISFSPTLLSLYLDAKMSTAIPTHCG